MYEHFRCSSVLLILVIHYRNMCIVGGESFIGKICEMNVILPLKNLLYKVFDVLNGLLHSMLNLYQKEMKMNNSLLAISIINYSLS